MASLDTGCCQVLRRRQPSSVWPNGERDLDLASAPPFLIEPEKRTRIARDTRNASTPWPSESVAQTVTAPAEAHTSESNHKRPFLESYCRNSRSRSAASRRLPPKRRHRPGPSTPPSARATTLARDSHPPASCGWC